MSAARIRWAADRDGVAHGHRPGHPRTLCRLPAIAERYAWPTVTRCPACLEAVGLLPLEEVRP